MTRKTIWLAIFLLLIYFIQLAYVDYGKTLRKSETLRYLISKGYRQNEITSVQVYHSYLNVILSYDEWVTKVIFKDEPNARYYYQYRNGTIYQNGEGGDPGGNYFMHDDAGPRAID